MNPTPTPTPSLPLETLLAERVWVRSLARSLVRDENRADDLEQQTLLAALEHPPLHGDSPRGWLATVMRRAAGRERRGDWRRDRRQAVAVGPAAAPATADVVAQAECHGRVVQAVLALDEPYRTTLLLRFFEDLAPREVAARMNAPVETVRSRVQRGLAKLRETFDAKHGGDRRAWALPLIRLATGGAGGAGVGPGIAGWEGTEAAAAAASVLGASTGLVGFGARAAIATAAGLIVVGGAAVVWWGRGSADRGVPAASVVTARGGPEVGAGAGDAPHLAARSGASRGAADGPRAEPAAAADQAHSSTITGRVTRASDGSAVVGARVVAMRTDPGVGPDPVPVGAESDATGAFAIRGLEAGEYLVHATTADGLVTRGLAESRMDGFLPTAARVEAGGVARVTLVEDPGVVVDGSVLGPDGEPVAGAHVEAVFCPAGTLEGPRWAPSWHALADARGAFRFEGLLIGAHYTLAATSPDLPPARDSLNTGAPEERRVELRFERAWFVQLRGVDAESGRDVARLEARARVWEAGGYGAERTFPATGDGLLRAGPFPPRLVHLELTAPAYQPQGVDVPVPETATSPTLVIVELTRGESRMPAIPSSLALSRRRVHVTGPDGKPVERVGYLLVVRPLLGIGASIGEGLIPGEFDLPIGGGKDRWIEIFHPQSGSNVPVAAGHARVDVPPGDGPIEVCLPPESTLSGSVVGPTGAPVPGVLVRAIPARWPTDVPRLREASVSTARTGSDGRFLLRGLADESYELAVAGPADLEPVGVLRAAPGGAPLEVRLKAVTPVAPPSGDAGPAPR